MSKENREMKREQANYTRLIDFEYFHENYGEGKIAFAIIRMNSLPNVGDYIEVRSSFTEELESSARNNGVSLGSYAWQVKGIVRKYDFDYGLYHEFIEVHIHPVNYEEVSQNEPKSIISTVD